MSALTQAMQEYATAIRNDWSDFDGRCERDVIEGWIAEIENPTSKTIEQWRNELGLCPDGRSHWGGAWGHCAGYECPTYMAEKKEA